MNTHSATYSPKLKEIESQVYLDFPFEKFGFFQLIPLNLSRPGGGCRRGRVGLRAHAPAPRLRCGGLRGRRLRRRWPRAERPGAAARTATHHWCCEWWENVGKTYGVMDNLWKIYGLYIENLWIICE